MLCRRSTNQKKAFRKKNGSKKPNLSFNWGCPTSCLLAGNYSKSSRRSTSHEEAGVVYIDESSQLQAEMNHAASLRATYARETKYGLTRNNSKRAVNRQPGFRPGYSLERLELFTI